MIFSAWIAHSLLDSIVDSFFPFSDEIEKEVMAIEQLVYSTDKRLDSEMSMTAAVPPPQSEKERLPVLSEKNMLKFEETFTARTRFALSRPPLRLLYRRFLRYIRTLRIRWRPSRPNEKPAPSSTMITLRRMATTRRLVTSLARLLAAKSEVVTQLRKRLLSESGNGKAGSSEEIEVAMYMGDVQGEQVMIVLGIGLNVFPRSHSYIAAFAGPLRADVEPIAPNISPAVAHGCLAGQVWR